MEQRDDLRLCHGAAGGRPAPGAADRDRAVLVLGSGVVFPLAILASLTLYGLILGQRLAPVPAPDLVRVEAEARQWAWTFRYADAPGLVTHGLLHIPRGGPSMSI
ncbi:hypothetical protein ACFSHQ_00060 [Gemmobacter lanyuensis]